MLLNDGDDLRVRDNDFSCVLAVCVVVSCDDRQILAVVSYKPPVTSPDEHQREEHNTMTYTYFNPAPSTLDELKAMYRKLAIANHPDRRDPDAEATA